ncbi:hypothetical protein [Caedibacter taeniospiralis]|uniref:hypothetical protein n=1 Tax=Caedibacter taeniospiralis TaxID=28907 RepID=UPI0037BF2C11
MAAVVAHIGQFDDFLDLFSKKFQKFSANSSNCPYFEWGVVWRKNHGYITKNIYTQQQLKEENDETLKDFTKLRNDHWNQYCGCWL